LPPPPPTWIAFNLAKSFEGLPFLRLGVRFTEQLATTDKFQLGGAAQSLFELSQVT
jgi:hypothetical protein